MISANWSSTLISYCFHNYFKFHIKAIDLLNEYLGNNIEASVDNLDLILKWLSLKFFDTNPSVLTKSLKYLKVLFHALFGIKYHLLEPEAASFIPYLVLKIGDSKDTVRKGVKEIIKAVTKIYPYSKLFSYVMQGLNSKNVRQRAGCLEELGSMIELYGLYVCQPSPSVALKEIAHHISDRDNSVRNAALNCIAQAYSIGGEKVYKYVGQLSDNCSSLLEERIKHSTKTKASKTDTSIPPSTLKMSPAAYLNESRASVESEPKVTQLPLSAPGPLRFNTEDIKQIFKHGESSALVSELVHVNADEILNLSDIQLPQSRLRSVASLKLLNNPAEIETAVNLIMAQLTAQDIPVVKEAFAQVEEVLKQHDQAIEVLGSRVDQLLTMGALQYRYAHNKHMADENICKAEVVSLYRCVSMALVALFDNPVLAKNASRDVLRDLIPHLLSVMLDDRLKDLEEGDQVVKLLNLLIMRILQKSNQTHVLSALIKLLHDCVGSVTVTAPFTDLVMKCLWKMIRTIQHAINDLNVDRILLDIHVFLKAFPSSSWREKQCDTPLRTLKTILFKLVEIKNDDIMNNLSLITDCEDSDLVRYLQTLLARKNLAYSKSMSKNTNPDDDTAVNNVTQNKSSPSKSTQEALTKIFRKISCEEQAEGLAELYEFTQKHPEADIEPYLKTSSDAFQNYIRRGIEQLEKDKDSIKCRLNSALITFEKTENTTERNSNFYGIYAPFSEGESRAAVAFPHVPPCDSDTTPMDLVEWLKSVVASLGMDTSKYDSPAFLDKITGSGNDGPLSEEEMSNMLHDNDRYKKLLNDMKISMKF